MDMQAIVKAYEDMSEKTAIESLFSCLDKGIDDVEAGKLHTVDEAFQIIRDRMENENYHLKQRKHNKKGRINE